MATPDDAGRPAGCENCGFPDDELVLVRRVYLTPERWDRPGSTRVVEPPERWCVPCLTQYPCAPVDDPPA